MVFGGGPCYVPNLLKPSIEFFFGNPAGISLCVVGFRYPPGFRCIRINSMSFLMMALGSYGLPKNFDPLDTSYDALAILCQIIGFRLSKPICRQMTQISA